MIQRVFVWTGHGRDVRGEEVLAEVRRLGVKSVEAVRTTKVYSLEGLDEAQAEAFARRVLSEEITEGYRVNQEGHTLATHTVEAAYNPGVMNPEVASIMKVARDLDFPLEAVGTSIRYRFYGEVSKSDVERIVNCLLVNKTVQTVVEELPTTLLSTGARGTIRLIPIRGMSDDELMELSRDKLFLTIEEMRVIQAHFRGFQRDARDAELETLAQTWSEHCKHKTFNAKLVINGKKREPLMARLRRISAMYSDPDFVVSAFHDNSGAFAFYEGYAVCGKVETHNSPCALDSRGGAETGSGGVFRDIAGTGKSAKVILSTDIFCLAPPDLDPALLPEGCLNSHYMLTNVVAGVRNYGNRMGIPTANGSLHFHPDFRAKPTVIVGAYGIIPMQDVEKGVPRIGDKVVIMGGRTGRDGIHGATFSSAEMTDRTVAVNATAVQIGNAIEEKRMFDAIEICRERHLIQAITDCGAGGFSSAIGEMGSEIGVRVELEKAPLKYPGMDPWEIWISEAQERMVLAVAPDDVEDVFEIAREYNVEAVVLGEFTGSKQLLVTYYGETVCDLSMEFLHHGLPQRVMEGVWVPPVVTEPDVLLPIDWVETFTRVLSHPTIASKEAIVRRYDHGVQGATVLYPYTGVAHDGPSDAVVLRPLPGRPYGLVVSHGLNPILNRLDPYQGALWAGVEALANLVAVGGNPDKCALIDNFIWPSPDKESLGALDRAVDGCVTLMHTFRRPFISGKDSLSSTYRGRDGTVIKIPPVLCVSPFGRIPDVRRTVTADLKRVNSRLVLLGTLDPTGMGGSIYYETLGHLGGRVPEVHLPILPKLFRALYRAISGGHILSAHDVSEGGVGVALAEMCFGGRIGAKIDLSACGSGRPDMLFFNECAGTFILEVADDAPLHGLFHSLPWHVLGVTQAAEVLEVFHGDRELFTVPVELLREAWQRPMREIFETVAV